MLRKYARDEGLPPIDDVLLNIATWIALGKNPVLLGVTIPELQRLGRVMTSAIAASSRNVTLLQVQCLESAEFAFRVTGALSPGWIITSLFTNRPDLLLRFDL